MCRPVHYLLIHCCCLQLDFLLPQIPLHMQSQSVRMVLRSTGRGQLYSQTIWFANPLTFYIHFKPSSSFILMK
jgi:hypothetical protein